MEDNKDKDNFLVIEKAKTLDSEAISQIFETYYPKIYRYLYYRVKTKEDAEDLTSEVFVRLVKSIKNQEGNFEAWLYRIAQNILVDYYRRKAVRKDSPLNEEILETATSQDKDEPILTEDELRRVIEILTEEQKEIIILKFIEGYDNESISQITGKSIGAVKALQFRAMVALKEFFKKEKKI